MRNMGRYCGLVVALTFSVFLVSPAHVYAASSPDFSGSYLPEHNSKKKSADPTLKVIQTENAVEITRIKGNKHLTYHFSLDGVPVDVVGFDGEKGKSRAYIKEGNLMIESLWPAATAGGGKFVFRTTEKWELSTDGTLLTIRTDLDCPGNFCNSAPRTEKFRKGQ